VNIPPVKSDLMWWVGLLAVAACLISRLLGCEAGTQGMWLVMSIVAFERAW
jgi:hypothetical protein